MRHPQYKFANYFIQKGIDEGRPLTHMQIQKLVYFLHGYLLAEREQGSPIRTEFEAWKFGPVNPDIYYSLKDSGGIPINQQIIDSYYNPIKLSNEESPEFVPYLDKVWKIYGNKHGAELSRLTHMPDTPWAKIYQPNIPNLKIDNKLIKCYFEKNLNV